MAATPSSPAASPAFTSSSSDRSLSSVLSVAGSAGIGLSAAACGLYAASVDRWNQNDTAGKSALALGTVSGAVLFGALADRVGRSRALKGTGLLIALGAASCAGVGAVSCSAAGRSPAPWAQVLLSLAYFVVGLGAGGELPAAAMYVIESTAGGSVAESSAPPSDAGSSPATDALLPTDSAVALCRMYTFFLFGTVFASAVDSAAALFPGLPPGLASTVIFAATAVLAVLTSVWRRGLPAEAQVEDQEPALRAGDTRRMGFALLCECPKTLARPLAGTSLAWLLQGFALGGLSPQITHGAGDSISAGGAAAATLLGTLIAVPLYTMIFARCRRRFCQLVSFIVLAIGFAGFAAVAYLTRQPVLAIVISTALHTVNAAGVAPSVYLVPAEVFPTCVRAACLGISAAFGFVGASLGRAALPLISDSAGLPAALLVTALAACVGALGTMFMTPSYHPRLVQDVSPLRPGKDVRVCTLERLERGVAFRECPNCEVMVERDGGCNLVTCSNCSERWCFACGGKSCGTWACSNVESGEPNLESLPRLLWPRPSLPQQHSRSTPLVEHCDA